LIVHWPDGIKAHGELRHTPVHLIDVVPTMLELAGVVPPSAWSSEARPPLAGRSLVPVLKKDAPIEREFLYFSHRGNRGLRVGDWKIVAEKAGDWELYDLAHDRAESHDLATSHPAKVKELTAIWAKRDEEFRRQGATGKPLSSASTPKAAAKRP
jgi:arylsulfatase